MGKYSRKHIGEEYETREGYTAIIIDGGSIHSYCTIKILEWVSEVRVDHLKSGNVKYPYHPSVFGVGYFGDGKYKACLNGKNTKCYDAWRGIIRRCHDKKVQLKQSSYIGCMISDDWKDYQSFSEWFYKNKVDGWEVDKDLLVKGNKTYSKETCIFIPKILNIFISSSTKRPNNTSGYIGVSLSGCKSKKWRVNIRDVNEDKYLFLGNFSNLIDASKIYKTARLKMSNIMRNKMIEEYGITDCRILNNIK